MYYVGCIVCDYSGVRGINVPQNSVYVTVLSSKVQNNGIKIKINQMLLHKIKRYTVIPRLTKIIRSGITFFSRNVISLCDVVSSFLCHTHTDGKDKLLEWPDRSCLLLYVSAHIHKNIR